MGGIGSGVYPRLNSKATTDELYYWQIQNLVNRQCFKHEIASIVTTEWSDGFTLKLLVNNTTPDNPSIIALSDSLGDICNNVSVTRTKAYYGSYRYWFVCPLCSKKRTGLYYTNNSFACRECLSLAYESQNENLNFRNIRKAYKIYRKIGGTGIISSAINKPKYMHWRSFILVAQLMNQLFYLGAKGLLK